MEHPVGGESSTSNSTDASKWKYDVFLSFAGKDTRLKFTNHLDEAFKRIVVISKTYANSKWCLDELQKILESRKTLHRQVFPIFYDVDPADVRKQTKTFGKALAKHEKIFGKTQRKCRIGEMLCLKLATCLVGTPGANVSVADNSRKIACTFIYPFPGCCPSEI
ncbi:hypothetical protein K1719_044326 [Acacia pycnantha]|nr:hypothetical protein K1719_044326 [Acacia pycnantha]